MLLRAPIGIFGGRRSEPKCETARSEIVLKQYPEAWCELVQSDA
jgi:hypothetical protein